eukprot:4864880-Heterocapsa_arctica.AAC.1
MDWSSAPSQENPEKRRWKARMIMKSTLVSDHTLIGASIGWGRKKTMHIMCVYGLVSGQTNPGPEEGNK